MPPTPVPRNLPPSIHPFAPETSKSTQGKATTTVRTDVAWTGPSQTFHIIVAITPEEGWHVYWKNPGASGAPTEIEIEAPQGFHVGEPLFPRPSTFSGEEGLTFGFAQEAAIFVPVTAPATLSNGEVSFKVTTNWLSCKGKCVMGEQTHSLTVPSNRMSEGPKYRDMRLSQWERRLPQPISEFEQGSAVVVGNTLQIAGESSDSHIQFIGVEQKEIRFGEQEALIRSGGEFRLPIPIFPDFTASKGEPILIEGILLVGRKNSDPSYVVRVVLEFHELQNKSGVSQ
jgi:thiol:disulfide interchange protein DsbD